MKNLTDFRKTVETGVDPRLIIKYARLREQDFAACKNFSFNQCHNKEFCDLSFKEVIAKFIVSHCVFCKLQRKLGFFCSFNHLSGPLWKQMFPCDCCILIHFVCFCVSRFIACD